MLERTTTVEGRIEKVVALNRRRGHMGRKG